MGFSSIAASNGGAAPRAIRHHEHLVEFYETDAFLIASVGDFIGAALHEHEAGLVVATPEHRAAFAAELAGSGVDVEGAIADGRYVEVDAATLLSTLTVDGALDPARFRDVVGSLLDRASAGSREVRVYGEMVALLLAGRDAAAAIALEDLWNELASDHSFELLCGYPIDAFNNAASGPFKRICEQHTAVIPTESYPLNAGARAQQRIVAGLQQEAAWLRAALDRLLFDQESLIEMAYLDPLTGLGNRRAFDRQLEHEWALAKRDADSFVVVADLDGLKALNDSLGHSAGDAVLRQFAAALRAAARRSDVLARIGGDEFAILLVRCDERATHSFRRRLGEAMALHMSPLYGSIGVSVGHASLRQADAAATALDRADLAMLATKRARRRQRSRRPGRG